MTVQRYETKLSNKEMEIDRLSSEIKMYDLQSKELEKKNREIERLREDILEKHKREEEL